MDYYLLTDMTAQIGYELAAAGAETFRIEETMRRVLAAYGIECEAFAIPNCVMVSLEADNGTPPAAPTPFPSTTSAIFLPRRASAPSLAEPCATACGRA